MFTPAVKVEFYREDSDEAPAPVSALGRQAAAAAGAEPDADVIGPGSISRRAFLCFYLLHPTPNECVLVPSVLMDFQRLNSRNV